MSNIFYLLSKRTRNWSRLSKINKNSNWGKIAKFSTSIQKLLFFQKIDFKKTNNKTQLLL